LLRQAADAGINLFDTAPTYGRSEYFLGQALESRVDCHIATKVPVPKAEDGDRLRGAKLQEAVENSLNRSHEALQRATLDIVQIHNATLEVINQGEMTEALQKAQKQGKVRLLGASVYTEAEAMAVIETGCFDTLQVAYSLFDQRMARRVFPAAQKAGLAIIVRSALLKGVLTARAQWLPDDLSELRERAEKARDVLAGGSWQDLPDIALRFCLSHPQVLTVLVGVRDAQEMKSALAASKAGPLPENLRSKATALAMDNERLLNPSYWPVA